MSFEVRGRCETPSYFFVYVASSFLSTCLRSKPLLACGQRALRAYVEIGVRLFVQARYPHVNRAKLPCSCICPLSLGAFVLLLRSLEKVCSGKIVIPKERSDCGNLPFILLKNWHSDQKMCIFVVSSGIKNHKTDILKVFFAVLI